jgi:hypothetical protein
MTIIYKHSQRCEKALIKITRSALWEKRQAKIGERGTRVSVLSVDLWSVQEPSFAAPCFVDLSSYQLLLSLFSLTHVASEREKVRAKRGADDASYSDLVQLRSSSLLSLALVTEFKCMPVAIITFSLFHPCICLSLSLSFSSAKATSQETWSMRKRRYAKETASTRKFHLHFTRRLTPQWPTYQIVLLRMALYVALHANSGQ